MLIGLYLFWAFASKLRNVGNREPHGTVVAVVGYLSILDVDLSLNLASESAANSGR